MKSISTGICPVCDSKLMIGKLVCPSCQAEFPVKQERSRFDSLSDEQMNLLVTFLACEGNYKNVQESLNLSYIAFKNKFEELLIALDLKQNTFEKESFERMKKETMKDTQFKETDGMKPSDIVRAKLAENSGRAVIPLLNGDHCVVRSNGHGFTSDKLGTQAMDFRVFDIIVDFLKENHGIAPKGMGRNFRVGVGKCSSDTVMYAIATEYYGKKDGESTFDPVFVLAAILDWADIAYNERGFISLKSHF